MLALIVMSALATLGSLTVVSVQSSLKTSTNDRFQAVAVYAAESGAAAAMVTLRQAFVASPFPYGFGAMLLPGPPPVFGNNVAPGAPGSPFTNDQNASYSVAFIAAHGDPGASRRIVIHSTGYAAQGATAIVEWEVGWDAARDIENTPATAPTNHGLILLGWRVVNL